MLLSRNEEKFLGNIGRRQKFLIATGIIAVIIAILWCFFIDLVLDKFNFSRHAITLQQKIMYAVTQVELQTGLRNPILARLGRNGNVLTLAKYSLVILISVIMLSISLQCFLLYSHDKKFLTIIKKLRKPE